MASTPRTPRRGLPRVPGGEPWPPAASGVPDVASSVAAGTPGDAGPEATGREAAPSAARTSQNGADPAGIPRDASSIVPLSEDSPVDATDSGQLSGAAPHPVAGSHPGPASDAVAARGADAAPAAASVRRGLPREPGGEPWPPEPECGAGSPRPTTPADAPTPGAAASGADAIAHAAGAGAATSGPGLPAPAPTPGVAASGSGSISADPLAGASTPSPEAPVTSQIDVGGQNPEPDHEPTAPRPPLTVRRTVWPGVAATAERPARTDPKRIGPYTPLQWLGSAAVLGVFALALAGITVLVARFLLALGPGQEFLAAYPGEYPLPDSAPVGIPAWLNWSHFLNSFFLLFIIRTGWQVRNEKRPAAFWSPRKNKRRRISLTLWFHQAIDILWIANGVVFVVLLVVTGQWMRIVPTSWEVFPHALSAALQYVSLDWPTENGWVNYNSLQQLSYFAITFLAAPLAIVSGVRLSGVWPKDAEKLNRLYPIEWARKVHFPVMVFFVAFIVVHVALVLATGALRNLNHMYAARGSVDPAAFTSDPTGLLIFAASVLVMAVGWAAARPAVLVPIARLFGEVKQR